MFRTLSILKGTLPNRSLTCLMSSYKKAKPIKTKSTSKNVRKSAEDFMNDELSKKDLIRKMKSEGFDDSEFSMDEFEGRLNPRITAEKDEGEMRHRKNIAAQWKIKRQYFPEEPGKNLLTWAAKEQIRFLHNLDPVEWTSERLSDCFPITERDVRSFLKREWVPKTQSEADDHDRKALKNWNDMLIEMDPVIVNYKKKKLSPHGNPDLPSPDSVRIGRPEYASSGPVCPPGKFSKILTTYNQLKSGQEPQEEKEVENYSHFNEKDDENDDILSATHLTGDKPIRGRHVQISDIRKKMVEHKKDDDPKLGLPVIERGAKTETKTKGVPLSKGKEKKRPEKEFFFPISKKQDSSEIKNKGPRVPEIRVDTPRKSKQAEAYLYDENTGYQHPFGLVSDSPDKLEQIPRGRRGSVIRFKDSFYDNKGEFIYRIPGLGIKDENS